jgi:hypothetical protein
MRLCPKACALPIFLLSSFLIAPAGAAFAAGTVDLAVKPMTPEAKTAAREKVLRAVTAKAPGTLDALWADAVTVGPRLWAAIRPEMPADADVVTTYLLVEKGLASRAGLQLADAAKVPEDKRKSVAWLVESGAKFGQVVVESGIVRHAGTAKLGELVAARLLKGSDTKVRDLSPLELQFFRGLVPYHLNEPVFTVVSGGRTLLMDFDADVKAVWIESAPDNMAGK